jgi:hypothetical protein
MRRGLPFLVTLETPEMQLFDYSTLDDERLADLLFMAEDRLELAAAKEIAGRDSMLPFLAQVVSDKQSWLSELPEWWAVVHSAYLLGHRGGEDVVLPLLMALRWSDAFDCDWVTELLPAILGKVGPPMLPGLTAIVRDAAAGWSARDLAMKGMASMSLAHPESTEHVFRIIGERFMDDREDRLVRQLAGQILLDFRRENYRMALIQFAREDLGFRELEAWYAMGFDPDEVDWAFHSPQAEIWHYQEEWMRFYDPGEIQRRQKRWTRERLGSGRGGRNVRSTPGGGGQLVHLWPNGKKPEVPGGEGDSE